MKHVNKKLFEIVNSIMLVDVSDAQVQTPWRADRKPYCKGRLVYLGVS